MTDTVKDQTFHGAKIAMIADDQVMVLLRDDFETIPFPNCWDFPGGAADAGETPLSCVLRETQEEICLSMQPDQICWSRPFISANETSRSWFFVAEVTLEMLKSAQLGDEGQQCKTMPIAEFLATKNAVPYLQTRLEIYLNARL